MRGEQAHFEDYLQRLRGRINDRMIEVSEEDSNVVLGIFQKDVFTEVVKESLEELGEMGDGEVCFFERRIGAAIARVNGWSVDENELRINLLTSIYRGEEESRTVSRREIETTAQQALRVFELARRGFHEQMERALPSFDMMQRLFELSGAVDQIRILVLVDGAASNTGGLKLQDTGVETRVEIWDLQRLYRAEASGLPYKDIEIDLVQQTGAPLPCLPGPGTNRDYRVFLTVFSGELIHDLYHEHGPRLLEFNVRAFLQARGKVNRGLRDTLDQEPDRFLAYNNGISATADEVDLVRGQDAAPAIHRIRGLQIVNGGQTVASIHRAKRRDRVDLSDVSVQAKITVIQPGKVEELVPCISRYANTQNRINEADFSANHPFHVQIEHFSKVIWAPGEHTRWFYERTRGQYEVARSLEATTPARRKKFDLATPVRQKIDKVRLAKYMNSWNQLPHIVSRGGQKCFVAFMQEIATKRGSDWLPDQEYYKRLIASAILFKKAESIARKEKLPAYRANAVAYTVSLLSYRTAGRVDLAEIWSRQEVSEETASILGNWIVEVHRELITSADGLNVTEWCKKERCWRHIQKMRLGLSSELESELLDGEPLPGMGPVSETREAHLAPGDRENIDRVMRYELDDWIRVLAWGHESKALSSDQTRIAMSLAKHAAEKWKSIPSRKDAELGAVVLDRFEKAVERSVEVDD